MEVNQEANSYNEIFNEEDKSVYENGDDGSSSIKQKSLFTLAGVILSTILFLQ